MPFQMPQTTMSLFPDDAYEGMLADLSDRVIDTGLADVSIGVGRGVVLGGGYGRIKLPTAGADVAKFQGFTFYEAMREPRLNAALFQAKDAVGVLRRGRLWLKCESNMTDDGDVFLVNGSGAGTAGMIRADANSGAATQLTRCKCKKGGTSGNLVLIEINLL